MVTPIDKKAQRARRARRHQDVLQGTPERPRVVVNRTNKAIYAQIVDDTKRTTLCSSSSRSLNLTGLTVENAAKVGEDLGQKALKAGITQVVFDRNGYLYHGRVKALAEALRAAGLKF